MPTARTFFVSIDDDGEPVEVTSTRVDDGQLVVSVAGEDGEDVLAFMRWLSDGDDDGVPERRPSVLRRLI